MWRWRHWCPPLLLLLCRALDWSTDHAAALSLRERAEAPVITEVVCLSPLSDLVALLKEKPVLYKICSASLLQSVFKCISQPCKPCQWQLLTESIICKIVNIITQRSCDVVKGYLTTKKLFWSLWMCKWWLKSDKFEIVFPLIVGLVFSIVPPQRPSLAMDYSPPPAGTQLSTLP